MGPAEIAGTINEYTVNFFTAERQTEDMRGKRYVSVIEIAVKEGLFDGGVAGTKELQPFMQSLNALHPYVVEKEGWEKSHAIFVREDAPANEYFKSDKLNLFAQVLGTRNADVLIVFNNEEIIIRMETTDPMLSAEKIEKIVTRQIVLLGKIRLPKT
jgi:hypothetical protein